MASTEPESDTDALRRLEERLERAAAAAERLLGDAVVAAGAGAGSSRPSPGRRPGESGPGPTDPGRDAGRGGANGPPPVPPAGWQRPEPDGDPDRSASGKGELDLLLAVLASVRDRIPPELQQRLADAVREVLLAVRALIDWYLERSERHRREPAQVQDIPIL
jgi:hypothetical protein